MKDMKVHELLKISVTTNQWSSGHQAWFDARLKPDTRVEVPWGDGIKSVLLPQQIGLSRTEHYYKRYESDETYHIKFQSDSPDALIELQDGLREMTLNHIDFIQCPTMLKIRIVNMPETDFTECPALEELDLSNCHCKVLDLHTAPQLHKLSCGYGGYLEKLILTGNDKLEELECQVSPRLTKVSLSNNSSLRRLKSYMTEIDETSMEFIDRTLIRNNQKEIIKRYRVVALGYFAGEIVDQLRAKDTYDDIKFVYCDSDERRLKAHGGENDEHILLTNMTQCREAIHSDNDFMSVLVADLYEDCSRQYAVEIMYELWSYSERTYCFASIPIWAGGKRESAVEVFKEITDYSNLTILQDNLKQEGVFFINRDLGTVHFLDLLLSHPKKGLGSECDELPFGAWATEKQILTALQAMYSNNPKMQRYYKARTYSFHETTHRY